MRKVLCSICLAGLALTTTALAERHQGGDEAAPAPVRGGSGRVSATAVAPRHAFSNAQPMHREISRAPFRTRTYTPQVRTNMAARNVTVNRNAIVRNRTVNRNATMRNATVAHNPTMRSGNLNRNGNVRVTSNARVTNNWRGTQFNGRNYAAFRNYQRQYHNRDWWRHHFNRVIFLADFGWWYWDAGYWYPAWGYDPYAYYPYDGPIYGYGNLTPDQIVTQVQVQLQNDGYYAGPVDGDLGPMTRQAIAAFQADHGLAVTSSVDEPTLATLGLS
jgi:hypothetical protein